jgi:hypothetical protein
MSAIIVVAKSTELKGLPNQGSVLLMQLDSLSDLAERAGLKRLDECLYIPAEVMEDFAMSFGAGLGELQEQPCDIPWISAPEGIELVDSYTEVVKTAAQWPESVKNGLNAELQSIRTILDRLHEYGDQWHLEYDI